jgi:signal transduction histidine kinase
MSNRPLGLEQRCAHALHRHLAAADEGTLHEAYEFGRSALAAGIGLLDMAMILGKTVLDARRTSGDDGRFAERAQGFVLESLSPFEMAYRGAREAGEALRKLDERREENVRRIARELHDQAAQLLATVFLSLDGLRSHVAPEGAESLARMAELLHAVEDEIRRVAHELRPAVLDDLGLLPALRFLAEGMAKRSGLSITVTGSTGGRLPARIETELYRAVQESMSNVVRHSHASRALIELRRTSREVRCKVRDDGRGFDPATPPAAEGPRGMGLRGIRERLAPLGGAMELSSQPREGTEVRIRIPLEVAHEYTSSACR